MKTLPPSDPPTESITPEELLWGREREDSLKANNIYGEKFYRRIGVTEVQRWAGAGEFSRLARQEAAEKRRGN